MPSDEQRANWEKALLSANMVDVLQAMTEIGQQGDLDSIPLLERAGSNVSSLAKQLSITLPDGKYKFEEFRTHCIEAVRNRGGYLELSTAVELPKGSRVFISYNHRDREHANQIALELSRNSAVDVFIDHWTMAPSDRILDRIENEIEKSDFLICLISPHSVDSQWVRLELEYAFLKQEKEGRRFIIPVLVADCGLPDQIADRSFLDWRRVEQRPATIQAIRNQIQGKNPFSQRVREFLSKTDSRSPYNANAQTEGRRLLLELARYPEMEIENNQRWLLWELFHELLGEYRCTLKIGPASHSLGQEGGVSFLIVDRWNETVSQINLTHEEFKRGLWIGRIDLLKGMRLDSSRLEFMGKVGRLSFNRRYNPDVASNPAEATAREKMAEISQALRAVWSSFDIGSQQSFLFDYQRLIAPGDWHTVTCVVGSGNENITLAFSPLVRSERMSGPGESAIFEVYDSFFSSLKVTHLYIEQLGHRWEGDADLMSAQTETLLGLA